MLTLSGSQGAILTTNGFDVGGATYYGRIKHSGAGGNFHLDTYGAGSLFLNWYSGAELYFGGGQQASKFSIDTNGNGQFAGDLTVNGGDITGKATNSAALNGAAESTSATANTIVKRDANGYIMGVYINSNISNESITPTSFYSSNDTWIRKVSTANAYKALVNAQAHQINFVYGGSASQAIDNTTVHNVWRSHAYTATITEVACWTDSGTVTLSVKDSGGNQVTTGTLACASGGASTTSMNATYSLIGSGEGLGFTTSSVSGVKNLSVSVKYTRAY
jgi:hypothetical protein